jgi:tRNA-Thr(GGU) m(6)t(6)A37 methyltransferase TsaA
MNLRPIGTVETDQGVFAIRLKPEVRQGLLSLEEFSHVLVLWWAHKVDAGMAETLVTDLPYAKGRKAGVFACRSPYRPNPIALTLAGIVDVDHGKGVVRLDYMDADAGTPVLDLKPYLPLSDRARDYRVAPWFRDWPDCRERAGEYFAAHPTDFGG